jgi:hypothetical protein
MIRRARGRLRAFLTRVPFGVWLAAAMVALLLLLPAVLRAYGAWWRLVFGQALVD